MAAMISVDVLDALVERGRELQQLLHQSPELMAFAEGLRQAKEPVLLLEHDRLVGGNEAAKILRVNPSRICEYVREGRLHPYFTPGSRNRKFLLSEVWKIPQREEADLGKKKEPEPAGPDTVDVLRG